MSEASTPSRSPGLVDLGRRTLVMGVLNVTPDSFSDGGRHLQLEAALAHAEQMRADGVDVIDVGGESTRPGAPPVPAEEEMRRVLPVIERLAAAQIPGISVDTFKANVARRAVEAGAEIINDVGGLSLDPDMAEVAADSGAYLILGHTRGAPQSMQAGAIEYPDGVVDAVMGFLGRAMDTFLAAGGREDKILVDPGIGFGKTLEHNLTLLRELRTLRKLGAPVVVGTSRKSFLGRLTGRGVAERSYGTASSVALAVANGADMVRVHDAKEMVDVVRVAEAIAHGIVTSPSEG